MANDMAEGISRGISRGISMVIRVLIFLLIAIAGFGQAVHYLWNWLMPGLFALPAITFWQSVGLLALSWLLFGGWRGFGGSRMGSGGKWRNRTSERWAKMTPDEREKFREGMRGRCAQVQVDAEPKP